MLESILDKGAKDEGRHLAVREVVGNIDRDHQSVSIAQTHQLDVFAQEGGLALQEHPVATAVIEHEAHHDRQIPEGGLGFLGIHVDEHLDVVQGVHEEMGVDLKPQILQLEEYPFFLKLLKISSVSL